MPRRNKNFAVRDRRVAVAHLYATGWPQHKIAKKLGVTQQQISLDIKAIRAEWQRTMAEEYDRLKAEQLAKIDAAEAEAWRGWRRSQRDSKKVTEKRSKRNGGVRAVITVREENRAGDPRFLLVVLACIVHRCRLFGLDAPKSQGLGGVEGYSLPQDDDLDDLSEAELDERIACLQEIIARAEAGGVPAQLSPTTPS